MYNIQLKVLGHYGLVNFENVSYVVTDTHYHVIWQGGEQYFTKIHTMWFRTTLVVRT